jgi:O-methyltransferase
MRSLVVNGVKSLLRRYGYDLVRSMQVSKPPDRADVPVDFDSETEATVRAVRHYTMTSPDRIYALCHALRYLHANGIDGAIVECGVWRGGSIMAAERTLLQLGDTSRPIYLFDTFAGMPQPGHHDVDFAGVSEEAVWKNNHISAINAPARAGLREVREAVLSVGYPVDQIHFVAGLVEDTIPRQVPDRIALLRLDTDYYESTRHELTHLYPRLAAGGVLIVDDYGHFLGARKAVDEYFTGGAWQPLLNRIDYSGRLIVKAG